MAPSKLKTSEDTVSPPPSVVEKPNVYHDRGGSNFLDGDLPTFDKERSAKLLRKMDWNLVPFLSLLYLLSYLDRANIGNGRLEGLEKDLKMKGLDYNIALAVFFPFYVAAEIPSNLMMKRMSPSSWLCIIMIAWSVCMTLMGIVTTFPGLLVGRMALGLAEGGLFPGVTWYLTLWYRRHECGLRMALFFSAATIAGAFGGLLARGISEMRGIGGKPGWAWIFIIEGLATFVVALFAKWAISDGPETAIFLTEEERHEVQIRMKQDRASLDDEYHIKYLFAALKDWKIYVYCLIKIGTATPVYSFSLFLPTIVRNMGYTTKKSQLMTVPPYVLGCIVTIWAGYAADRSKQRGIYMMTLCLVAITGFILLISTRNPHVQYAGTFLAASGLYPTAPMSMAWNANNIGGATKRAVGIAMQVGFANIGGIIGAFTYRSKDAPRYLSGHGLLIGLLTMSFVLSLLLHLWLKRENLRRDEAMRRLGYSLDSYNEEMKHGEREKGEYATFFRYTE